jgi:Spy/CpxP family protein refolding chaperone
MFKPLAVSLILALSFSFGARADAPSSSPPAAPGEEKIDVAVLCPELVLTQVQKDQLEANEKAFKTEIKEKKAILKEAKKLLMATLSDATATESKVMRREFQVKREVSELLNIVFGRINKVVFAVLTKEQRATGVACYEKVKQEMKKRKRARQCSGSGAVEDEDSDIAD